MPGLQEVAQHVQRARDQADRCAATFRQAGQLARNAVELIQTACQGAVALEYEAAQVVRQWNDAADGADELTARLSGLDMLLQGLLTRLTGIRDANRSVPESTPPPPATPGTSVPDRVARQRRYLPEYITSGRYDDETGKAVLVQSGRGAESPEIARHLFDTGILPRRGMPFVAMHVEPKVAWRMRTSGRDTVELVINNKVCQGDLSCRKLVEDILYEGQTLVVHDPTEKQPLVFKGRSPR